MYWQNTVDGYCDGKEKLCDEIVKFINTNTKWVKKKLKSHKNIRKHPYWHHLGLIYEQLEGLEAGYDKTVENETERIPHGDIFWMNVFGDLEDLEQVFDMNDDFNKTREFNFCAELRVFLSKGKAGSCMKVLLYILTS